MYKKIAFVLVILIIFHTEIRSEIVILKSGERIEGKITNQSRTKIELLKEDGTKLVIDKDKIEKIQFGPTQREIEEKRRIEEERRRKEEERLRQEEERRRIEEERLRKEEEERLKREEEERIRREEERKKEEERRLTRVQKELFEKRHGLEVGYGVGSAYIVPMVFKIYDFFSHLFTSGYIFFGSNNRSKDTFQYNYESENDYFFLRYLKDNIETGFSYAKFLLDNSNFKSINRYQTSTNRTLQFVVLGKSIILGEPKYGMYNLWFIYNLRQTNILKNEAILGIETNLYGINTKVNQQIDYDSYNTYRENVFIRFKTNKNNFISLGPNLRILVSSRSQLKTSVLLSSGNMKPVLNYSIINSSYVNKTQNFLFLSVNFLEPIKATGIYFKANWDYKIYKNLYFFITYLYNENQYKLRKISAYLYSSNPSSNSPPILTNSIIDILSASQKKIAIEKNQYLNIGLSYKFNLI